MFVLCFAWTSTCLHLTFTCIDWTSIHLCTRLCTRRPSVCVHLFLTKKDVRRDKVQAVSFALPGCPPLPVRLDVHPQSGYPQSGYPQSGCRCPGGRGWVSWVGAEKWKSGCHPHRQDIDTRFADERPGEAEDFVLAEDFVHQAFDGVIRRDKVQAFDKVDAVCFSTKWMETLSFFVKKGKKADGRSFFAEQIEVIPVYSTRFLMKSISCQSG